LNQPFLIVTSPLPVFVMASQNAEANSGGDGAAAEVNPDNGWIVDIVNGILPMLQAPANPARMDEGNQGWLAFLFIIIKTTH
jgi:hypothetical protein